MASKVVIVNEKPSQARNFAKALGGRTGKLSDGSDYEIVHLVGHIFSLADVHKQVDKKDEEKFHKWSWDTIPFNPDDFYWRKVQNPKTTDIMKSLKSALSGADEVVCATDVDPSGEGALLFAEPVIEKLKYKGKITRAYFADESAKEIKKAIDTRKEIKDPRLWDELAKANCRSKFDFLSISWTRMTTLAAADEGKRAVTRQGRLKSVMVYLVGEQIQLCNSYVKKPFFEAAYVDENGHWYRRKPDKADRKENKADVDLSSFGPSPVKVDKVEQKKTAPGRLLDLAGLSGILASRGYKPKSVLGVYQKMYEDNVLSYIRTEDRVVTLEQYNELLKNKDKIARCVGVDPALLTHTAPRKQHIGNGSHGANRPGPNVPASLDDVEAKYGKLGRAIYQILAKQTLAIFGEDYVYEHQTGHIELHPDFVGSANVPISMGYKAIFDAEAESSDKKTAEEDPDKDGGEGKPLGKRATSKIKEGHNPKPSWPTVRWLVRALERSSVGTGATRTNTLAQITNTNSPTQLMEEKKGRLSMTYIGDCSYVLIKGTWMADVKVTEKLFSDMEEVGKFKKNPDDVLDMVRRIYEHDLPIVKKNAANLKDADNMKAYAPKEKHEDIYEPTGEKIKFNKTWGKNPKWDGHTFTEEEIKKLLAGEEISFEAVSKKGKKYTAEGKLGQGSFKGRKFWGFQLKEREKKVPETFCGHDFTDDEITALERGDVIHVDGLISKKGKEFSADISYKNGKLDLKFG